MSGHLTTASKTAAILHTPILSVHSELQGGAAQAAMTLAWGWHLGAPHLDVAQIGVRVEAGLQRKTSGLCEPAASEGRPWMHSRLFPTPRSHPSFRDRLAAVNELEWFAGCKAGGGLEGSASHAHSLRPYALVGPVVGVLGPCPLAGELMTPSGGEACSTAGPAQGYPPCAGDKSVLCLSGGVEWQASGEDWGGAGRPQWGERASLRLSYLQQLEKPSGILAAPHCQMLRRLYPQLDEVAGAALPGEGAGEPALVLSVPRPHEEGQAAGPWQYRHSDAAFPGSCPRHAPPSLPPLPRAAAVGLRMARSAAQGQPLQQDGPMVSAGHA